MVGDLGQVIGLMKCLSWVLQLAEAVEGYRAGCRACGWGTKCFWHMKRSALVRSPSNPCSEICLRTATLDSKPYIYFRGALPT